MNSSESFILRFIRVILTCELLLSLLTYEPLPLGCVHSFSPDFLTDKGLILCLKAYVYWHLKYKVRTVLPCVQGPSAYSQLIPPQLHMLLLPTHHFPPRCRKLTLDTHIVWHIQALHPFSLGEFPLIFQGMFSSFLS